ncbi:hypothetical protein Tco_1245055 [Tanacetum coccineum]
MQQLMQNLEDISDPTTAIDMALILMAKAFKLNITTPTNNNQRSLTNPRNRQIAQPGMNMDQDRHMLMVEDNVKNQFRLNAGQIVENHNVYNALQNVGNQLGHNAVQNSNIQKIENQSGNGNVVAARAEVKPRKRDATYLQTQLQIAQKEEAGIQLNYEEFYFMAAADEVHHSENCYDDDIFNMFTQEEQYTELLKPITEPQPVQQNTSNVIVVEPSMEHNRGTVEQHPATVEETQREKLKNVFKTRENELLDKLIESEKKIKELDNILVKIGQSIQTMHMLSPKPDSFYHTEHKTALGYQNPLYLKQAQKKKQSLYNGNALLNKYDPLAVYDSEETLQLAQESRLKMKQLDKEIKRQSMKRLINFQRFLFLKRPSDEKRIDLNECDVCDDDLRSVDRSTCDGRCLQQVNLEA